MTSKAYQSRRTYRSRRIRRYRRAIVWSSVVLVVGAALIMLALMAGASLGGTALARQING